MIRMFVCVDAIFIHVRYCGPHQPESHRTKVTREEGNTGIVLCDFGGRCFFFFFFKCSRVGSRGFWRGEASEPREARGGFSMCQRLARAPERSVVDPWYWIHGVLSLAVIWQIESMYITPLLSPLSAVPIQLSSGST